MTDMFEVLRRYTRARHCERVREQMAGQTAGDFDVWDDVEAPFVAGGVHGTVVRIQSGRLCIRVHGDGGERWFDPGELIHL